MPKNLATSFYPLLSRERLPPTADSRLQRLMDRNDDGLLTAEEREDLPALVDWSEAISLVRADALQLLGRNP